MIYLNEIILNYIKHTLNKFTITFEIKETKKQRCYTK